MGNPVKPFCWVNLGFMAQLDMNVVITKMESKRIGEDE